MDVMGFIRQKVQLDAGRLAHLQFKLRQLPLHCLNISQKLVSRRRLSLPLMQQH
jgi:hypothetical protein